MDVMYVKVWKAEQEAAMFPTEHTNSIKTPRIIEYVMTVFIIQQYNVFSLSHHYIIGCLRLLFRRMNFEEFFAFFEKKLRNVKHQKTKSTMDFCCGHPGAKSYAKKKNIVRSPGLIFPDMEKRKNKMYLAKANQLNITFMPMASDVYGSMSVTFLSVLTKAAEMISEITGIPLHQVAKHWIQRISTSHLQIPL
jgi:hypothetical protein